MKLKKNRVSQEQEKRFPFNSLEIFVGKSSITNFMVMIVLHVLRIVENDQRRYLKHYGPDLYIYNSMYLLYKRHSRYNFYLSVLIKCLAQKCLR